MPIKFTRRTDGNDSSHAQTPSAGVKASHGRFGEDAAAQYLTDNGYTIKGRNVRFGRHELDIIAEDDEYIVFVEVKTRTEASVRTSAAYDRLVNMGQRLMEVIRHNQGGANKDLAKFASQIASLCDKWDR